jgi:hypothetical protein
VFPGFFQIVGGKYIIPAHPVTLNRIEVLSEVELITLAFVGIACWNDIDDLLVSCNNTTAKYVKLRKK